MPSPPPDARQRSPHLPLTCMDASALGYRNASFDDVWFAFNGLDFLWPQGRRVAALAEVLRVLRPGGRFIFSSHNPAARLMLRRHKMANILRNRVQSPPDSAPYWRIRGAVEREALVFHQTPPAQVAALRQAGFREVEVISRYPGRWLARYADHWPHYVARRG